MRFPDVDEKSYYVPFIEKAAEAGIIIGDDKGNYRPKDPLTRAEAAVIICRLLDVINQDK